jgi:vacuolar-type H+-ATPase subunit H
MTKRTSQKIKNMSQKYPEISTKIISGYLYWCDENDFCASRMLESVKNWFTKVGYPISDITLEYLIEASIRKMNRRKILGSKASSVTDISLVMVFFPDLELATKIFTKNSKDKMKKALSTLDANPILRKQGSNESIRERLGKESEDRIRDAKGKNQRIEFFVNQGYSEEEAKIMLSERQSTFSLKKCIEKYGNEKGMEIFKDRQDKWQSTLKSKTEEEILEMNKKKGITLDRMIEKYGVSDGNIRYKNWLHMLNNRILSIRSVSNESLKFFRSFIPDDILTEALFGRK